ncbi:MAG TPA: signal peptidase I [Candidatus Moranbacteria bacterium]|nr:signal peptidase I [Candidatus Moranbacteria bacterium]HAT74965.1 signal peptidase I [Candidatus Moranbacteria bacterium]
MLENMEEKKLENRTVQNSQADYIGVGSFVLEIIKIVALAFIIIFPIRVFLFQPFFVQGASMEPNFEDGQYLIVNELGYKKTTIAFGDSKFFSVGAFKEIPRQKAIVFRYPNDPSKYFIKRIIGLPGEKIEIKNGSVKIFNSENIDGFILDESVYLEKGARTDREATIILKDNEYFVMGDNRQFSSDSRVWGPITDDNIIGEVLLRAWPLNEISAF